MITKRALELLFNALKTQDVWSLNISLFSFMVPSGTADFSHQPTKQKVMKCKYKILHSHKIRINELIES